MKLFENAKKIPSDYNYDLSDKKEMAKSFRHYCAVRQYRNAFFIMVFLWGFSLIGYFLFGNIHPEYLEHSKIQYSILFVLCLLGILLLIVGQSKSLIKSRKAYDLYYEIVFFIFALSFITWGFLLMYYSIIEQRATSFVPILIIYSVCVFFFYFRIQIYILFFLFCVGAEFGLLYLFKSASTLDLTTMINVLMYGMLLTLAGILKYRTAYKEYVSRLETEKLKSSIEENNEVLKSANENLQNLTEELKKKNESQFVFTSSMNHELRSPLNGTIGLLQILNDDKSLTDEQHDYVEKALASSSTLIQIVNDLLDYSKIEIGQFEIQNEPYDIRKMMHEVDTVMVALAEKKQLIYASDLNSQIPFLLLGDVVRVKQIITNLVTNGIKYTEHGYVKVSLEMEDEQNLLIRVVDSGQGMSQEALSQLFTPFKRFNEKNNKYIQGTGLGLTIVNSLVKGMNGFIEVMSKPGSGSMFTVHIPTQEVKADDKYNASWLKKDQNIVPTLSNTNVLCVDDNKVNLTVFKGIMKSTGAKIVCCQSGMDALEILKNQQFDIVFLDHMMPQMDGIETFEAIRVGQLISPETPVVMLTANAGAEAEQLYMNRGFSGYLSKPLIKNDLYKILDELIK